MAIANDIRSLTDPDNVVPPTMGVQRLGAATVRGGRAEFKYLTTAEQISDPDSPHPEFDPNNIVDKYDSRFDNRGYYV